MTTVYTNPVYDGYFADPFVLWHEGHYYAYGTGPTGDERVFPVLHSLDLVTWESCGGALLPPGGNDFWAPEVAFHDGMFYMYYAAKGINGQDHQLRVATSRDAYGPFKDCGHVLVPDEPFSIDAHPFRDANGEWYLFYAQDFLTLDDDYRVGTGIVVDRLLDMRALAGEARVVVRPHADWHLFLAQRPMYGSVYDWHTIEGPSVRMHNGRYYCFYSGGAWERENYGVSYVVADHPLGPYRRPENGVPLLKSLQGKVIGPGHNSFTRSPGGKHEMIVYHAWDAERTARRLCIDLFFWEGDTPRVAGPTWTPQPLPD